MAQEKGYTKRVGQPSSGPTSSTNPAIGPPIDLVPALRAAGQAAGRGVRRVGQTVQGAAQRGVDALNTPGRVVGEATRDILRRDKLRQIRAAVERAETGGSEAASRAKARKLAPRPNMGQPARPRSLRGVLAGRAKRRAERRATRLGAPRRR